MTLSNINTSGLETMNTKDCLSFLNAILSDKRLKDAKQIFTGNNHIKVVDKKFEKMSNITLLVQAFDGTPEGEYYILTQSVGTDYSCSNAVIIKNVTPEEWRDEAMFIKRYNELF